jgi:hypothetical protein
MSALSPRNRSARRRWSDLVLVLPSNIDLPDVPCSAPCVNSLEPHACTSRL